MTGMDAVTVANTASSQCVLLQPQFAFILLLPILTIPFVCCQSRSLHIFNLKFHAPVAWYGAGMWVILFATDNILTDFRRRLMLTINSSDLTLYLWQ
jgi:hypothetical protein